jgi:glycosyltransferase involved in cell wall biosynthesis
LVAGNGPDTVYLNSFFDPIFTQRILWARRLGRLGTVPVILAPRGEFSSGALQLNQTKKRLYLRLSSFIGLYRGLTWQASSELERADIQRHLRFVRTADIRIAMNLAPLEEPTDGAWSPRPDGEPLRVCFLSRIAPMKNLDFALRVLAAVRAPVVFTVYGPKEVPAYWAECERLIARLPPNVRVDYGGSVHPDAVKQTMAQHDLFCFPTRGENYGHVIHEALHAGLPVLISDQTPWGAVAERGVGWACPLNDVADFARTIDEVAAWEAEHLARVRTRATAFAKEKTIDAKVLQANKAVFTSALARGGA